MSGLLIVPVFALVMSIIGIYLYRSELHVEMICHLSVHSRISHTFEIVLPGFGAYTRKKSEKVYAYFMTNKLNIARCLAW